MFESLERMVAAIWLNDVSMTFAILIGVYFVFSFLNLNSQNRRLRILVENAPGAMTSLGILGTFFGIFVGLLDFDIRTINKSVPTLLEGLKVAFGTSIVGLAAAIFFRITSPLIARDPNTAEDASINDIIAGLTAVEKSTVEANVANREGLESLQRTLTDDKDTSIVGQLQRLRASISDLENSVRGGFEEQIKEFRKFSGHMSEAFSKAIIDELKLVIKEFNEKLSEQFGENFKQLNAAVGRLLEWQEQYREQMEQLKAALDNAVAGIEKSAESLNKIENSAQNIPTIIEKMGAANENINKQIADLTGHLSAFADVREKATNAFPKIEENIENVTTNMRLAVEKQAESFGALRADSQQMMTDMKQSSQDLATGFEKLNVSTKETIDSLSQGVNQATRQLSEDVTSTSKTMTAEVSKITQEISKSVEQIGVEVKKVVEDTVSEQRSTQKEMLDGLQTSFNETVSSTTSSMNDAIKQLDEAMQSEIQSVVQAMAENLSGIAQKFVSDYQPLLEETRQIVELGRRANRNE